MSQVIEFEKWHGCMNDFIVLFREETLTLEQIQTNAPQWCGRKGDGIGADGILAIEKPSADDQYRLNIVNSDGSMAATCGNGIRCAAAFIASNLGLQPQSIKIQLMSGIQVVCSFIGDSYQHIAVSMGIPNQINSENIGGSKELKNILTNPPFQHLAFEGVVNLQNDHMVFHSRGDLLSQIREIGPVLQSANKGDGINVHLYEEIDLKRDRVENFDFVTEIAPEKIVKAVCWERGAGETMACGSGACSIAHLIYQQNQQLYGSWIAIDMPGGRLFINQKSNKHEAILLGPAAKVFDGKLLL